MRRLTLSLLLALAAATARAQTPPLEFGVEGYLWQEFDTDGSRLLTEFGPRYRLGYHTHPTPALTTFSSVYLGDVYYDGQLQDGTPYSAITGYYGVNGEARWSPQNDGLAPEASLGLDLWLRQLDKWGNKGYLESYTVVYSRLGLRFGGGRWSGRTGVRHPPGRWPSWPGGCASPPGPSPASMPSSPFNAGR